MGFKRAILNRLNIAEHATFAKKMTNSKDKDVTDGLRKTTDFSIERILSETRSERKIRNDQKVVREYFQTAPSDVSSDCEPLNFAIRTVRVEPKFTCESNDARTTFTGNFQNNNNNDGFGDCNKQYAQQGLADHVTVIIIIEILIKS